MTRLTKSLTLISLILILTSVAYAKQNSNVELLAGERLVNAAGYPAVVYFQQGQPNKPLVVFFPGMFHLARIAYGVPGTNKKDFLAYWLHKKGYSFLGISYPSDNAVFSKAYPEFTIQDWATQSCATIKKTIKTNNLSNQVIVLAWSMAGALARDLNIECAKRGSKLQAFIGLSAVPGDPYIMNKRFIANLQPNPKGLVSLEAVFLQWFKENLNQQNAINHHQIIAPKLYRRYFLGAIPVNINASSKRYKNGKFIDDIPAAINDAGTFDFENYPWIGLIVDDSHSDLKISSVDPYNWYRIITNGLYWKYVATQQDKLSANELKKLQSIFRGLPADITKIINGSHFFFVGGSGAKRTVEYMEQLVKKIENLKKQFAPRTSKELILPNK